MSQITVKVRSDIGDPGRHPKYGALTPGDSVTIDEEDFGAGLFDRPTPDYLSPHELADKAKGEELKQSVGTYEYIEPPTKPVKTPAAAKGEVTNAA
jgi:hypothetical protein